MNLTYDRQYTQENKFKYVLRLNAESYDLKNISLLLDEKTFEKHGWVTNLWSSVDKEVYFVCENDIKEHADENFKELVNFVVNVIRVVNKKREWNCFGEIEITEENWVMRPS